MNVEGMMTVEVAVTICRDADRWLVGYNIPWSAYTLPMTKRQISQDPDRESESWLAAAQRNVNEWLAVADMPRIDHLLEIVQFRQSDRDLIAKDYHFQIYEAQFSAIPVLLQNVRAEWLTRSELQQLHRRPISPTTRFLVQELAKHNLA